MLAALVVMVLAATFVLVVVGAVSSVHVVESADAASWRADALAGEATSAAGEDARWRPMAAGGLVRDDDGASANGVWEATWSPAARVSGDLWPRITVELEATSGRAQRDDAVGMELRAEPWASGVVCAGDAVVEAPLVIAGSGLYVGGSVQGREDVGFAQGAGAATPAGAPVDHVRGEMFPAAAVHARAGIYAHGVEIHDALGEGLWPYDTDAHAGAVPGSELVRRPSAGFLAAAAARGLPVGEALSGTRLSLDDLVLPAGDVQGAAGGWCVVTPSLDQVAIDGVMDEDGARVLLVVPGDAVVGRPGVETHLYGGLVVCGELELRGEVRLDGSLFAGHLRVSGPAIITVSPEWRLRPLAGACRPVITERGV